MATPKDGHDGRLGYACLKGTLELDRAYLKGALRRTCLAGWLIAELEWAQDDAGVDTG